MGRGGGEGNTALLGLFGVDVALERPPAAACIERRVVRLAEQQGELDRSFVHERPDRSVERDAGVAAAPRTGGGGAPADAAGAHGPSVPRQFTTDDPDVGHCVPDIVLDQHPQLRIRECYIRPGQRGHDVRRVDRLEQGGGLRPRRGPIQDVDFNVHDFYLRYWFGRRKFRLSKRTALPNPVNDAASITRMFRTASFDVVESRRDLTDTEMRTLP